MVRLNKVVRQKLSQIICTLQQRGFNRWNVVGRRHIFCLFFMAVKSRVSGINGTLGQGMCTGKDG